MTDPFGRSDVSEYDAQRLLEHADWSFFAIEGYDIGLLLIGLIVLVATLLPRLVSSLRLLSAPLLYVGAGLTVFLMPWAPELPDLVTEATWPKRLTELGVIIALTSVGLKINRPFAWQTWTHSWRLLAITMPLTIVTAAWLGWWLAGLVPATAVLLGAVIAPTDPVLAADVQTTSPTEPDDSKARLALTTEAGLNDGLAFPFTNLAIALAVVGLAPSEWLAGWIVIDVMYKIAVGTLVGAATGWAIGKLIFGLSVSRRNTRSMTGLLALALTLVPYGLTEIASAYGFIAVFVAACVFRQVECDHDYHATLHDFSEEAERVMIAVLMFAVGAYVAIGALAAMTPALWLVAALLVFVVRPITGWLGLAGTDLPRGKRWAIAFFGIRGVGSLYYLAYAIHHADFPGAREIWALVLATVLLSVLVHGATARPIMALVVPERR